MAEIAKKQFLGILATYTVYDEYHHLIFLSFR